MKPWLAAALLGLAVLSASAQTQQPLPSSDKEVRPILLGEQAPAITLLSPAGESYTLKQLAEKNPIAIVFYRGGW